MICTPSVTTFLREFLLIIVCASSFTLLGQFNEYPQVLLDISNNNSGTAIGGTSLSNVLNQHNATLALIFPDAISAEARAWKSISCGGCDKAEVAQDLVDIGEAVMFETEPQEYSINGCETCPAPIPYNDPLMYSGLASNNWPAGNSQWPIESTQADCAWSLTDNTKPPVRIALIDQSIDLDHPDLEGNVSVVYTADNWVKNGHHGTVVAGGAVAHINNNEGIAGVCDVCHIDVYQIEHDDWRTGKRPWQTATMAFADGYKIVSVSFSKGGIHYRTAIAEAEAQGAALISSSGTGGGAASSIASPNVIIAGSTRSFNQNGPRGERDVRPDPDLNSNSFATIDFLAPGNNLVRTEDPDVFGKLYNSGGSTTSSVAAPYVAAAYAMVFHNYPCLDLQEVTAFLKETACTDLNGYVAGNHGVGQINIYSAMLAAEATVEGNQDPVIISDAVTISDETVYYNNNLIVSGGGSLVVSNSTLRFAEGYGIIVEEDGGFTAFSSTLENSGCSGEHWAGISVDGNAFKQGAVSSPPGAYLNGTTVRNATTGVRDFGQSVFAHNKGEITVVNNVFENCRTSIASSNPDQAPDITYNTFRVDDDYPHAIREHIGVKLTYGDPGQVTQLGSNVFEDLRSDKEVGGTAIDVLDASFSVGTATGSAGNSGGITTITGYLHGIKAFEDGINNHLATVRDCESFNTTVSTWIVGYNNPQVINNTFQAQSTDAYVDRFGALIPVQGIRMEMCRRHIVEGNTINGGLTVIGQTFGIVIIGDAVATTRDAVYNNTLNTCQFGMWSDGINSGSAPIEGLCHECNTFDGCETDIRAMGAISSRQQGVENGLTASAGNVFESSIMQFRSDVTFASYFRVNPSEDPNPRFQVTPVFTPISNSCLPIFGITGGESPCEDVDVEAFDTDRQMVKDYYETDSVSEEEALIALSEFNRKYVMFTRELIDEVDECESGSVEEWEDIIQTSTPWQPLDETLIAVYEGDYSSAATKIDGLEPLAGQIEVDRLIGLVELAQDIQESSTDDEVEAAVTNANLTAYLTESEIGQTYAQTLARATAESIGLVAYEARLSGPTDAGNGGNTQPLVVPTPYELQDVTIYDALGRQIANPNPGNYLTIDGLNEALSRQPNGIYYVSGVDQQGSIQTIAVSNVR